MNFPYSFTLKSISLFCPLNDLLPMQDAITLCTRFWENTGSLGKAEFPNGKPFLYMAYTQITLLISLLISKKSLSIGKLSTSQWQIHGFQNSNFHLKAQILWLATHTVGCFPEGDKWTLFIFQKIYVKCPRLNSYSFAVNLSGKNGISGRKLLVLLKQITDVLFLNSIISIRSKDTSGFHSTEC